MPEAPSIAVPAKDQILRFPGDGSLQNKYIIYSMVYVHLVNSGPAGVRGPMDGL